MEITRTFGSTFGYMMRAKLRNFARRSMYLYAAGTLLITMGLHPSLTTFEKFSRGTIYFAAVCLFAFVVYCVYALIQSRQFPRQTVTFDDSTIVVNRDGELTNCDWGWVISADESSNTIFMLIQKSPRIELYLPKDNLNDTELHTFRHWLISHGKLEADKIA